jgi:5-(carboxyamino)imidazole ribonucleotide synthase
MSPVLPGRTIGILGGGQLGRMFAIAARRMGYRVHAFDPTSDCPTGQIADHETNAPYDDLDAARRFAFGVDVVTFEFENVPAETLTAIEQIRPVHPSPFVLETTRHRLREKTFLHDNGFPVAPFHRVASLEDLHAAVAKLGTHSILKTAEFGYDGKGQTRIQSAADVPIAWKNLGERVGVLEKWLNFDCELSVVIARDVNGNAKCFPPGQNTHVNGILDLTIAPAPLPTKILRDAEELALSIAKKLDVIGVLAVEMFLVKDNLIVNELAPRPHNSGHFTFDACITSQFEQQLRAVCGLPLGSTRLLRPAAMANLLGDLWDNGEPNWPAACAIPEVHVHLYGKADPRPGRKMGHLTATADTPAQAAAVVRTAREALRK